MKMEQDICTQGDRRSYKQEIDIECTKNITCTMGSRDR